LTGALRPEQNRRPVSPRATNETMQVGILGFPKSGKTTLFNLLTASTQQTDKYAASRETHVGVATVPDPRLEKLRDLYQPRKYTPATVTYIDIPGVNKGEGSESLDLPRLREVDALMHVVRAFEDPEILHPEGSVDAARDVASLELELILADHELVTRRLERLEKSRKRGLTPEEEREEKLLREVVLPALDGETPLRDLDLDPDDEKRLRGFQLLSSKPLLLAVNVDEDRLGASEEIPGLPAAGSAIVVSASIEAEVAGLEGEEQADFLAELGLDEPSVHRIIRASYELLGLISFFTVGEDEVRAWTIRRGTTARRAARVIHSDLERGFIRAEVVPWDELVRLGGMPACREEGLLRLEGRDYVTRDGEIMHIRSGV
jgi:GTP-binding protein YchF